MNEKPVPGFSGEQVFFVGETLLPDSSSSSISVDKKSVFLCRKRPGKTDFSIYRRDVLFGDNQVIVLFTTLYQQVFFIQQVGCSNHLVESGQFFLVQ